MLLENGSDVNSEDSSGKTPLILACENFKAKEHVDSVTTILQYNPDINHQDKTGKTALHVSVENGAIDCSRALLNKGCCTNIVDNEGNTVFHCAAISGNIALMEILLNERCKENCDICMSEGDHAPLNYSLQQNHYNEMSSSHSQGDNLNDRTIEIWNKFFQNAAQCKANDVEGGEEHITYSLQGEKVHEGFMEDLSILTQEMERGVMEDKGSGLYVKERITVIDILIEIFSWFIQIFFSLYNYKESGFSGKNNEHSNNPEKKYYVQKLEPPDDLKKALKEAGLMSL